MDTFTTHGYISTLNVATQRKQGAGELLLTCQWHSSPALVWRLVRGGQPPAAER